MIVRKMNGERGTGDTLGQTLMDSVPVGNDGNTGSDLGFTATGNSAITHAHARANIHTQTLTHLSPTLFSPHSVLPESSLQLCNPAEGHKLNPVST